MLSQGNYKNLRNKIKKFIFLCDGKSLSVNTKGTIKENNIKEGKTIVVHRPFDES